jgi:hypothetical protein
MIFRLRRSKLPSPNMIKLTCTCCLNKIEISQGVENVVCTHCETEWAVSYGSNIVYLENTKKTSKKKKAIEKTLTSLKYLALDRKIKELDKVINIDKDNIKINNNDVRTGINTGIGFMLFGMFFLASFGYGLATKYKEAIKMVPCMVVSLAFFAGGFLYLWYIIAHNPMENLGILKDSNAKKRQDLKKQQDSIKLY